MLRTSEVAEKFSIHHQTVLGWIRNGVQVFGARHHLPATRIGRQYRIDPSALDEFVLAMNRQPISAEAPAVSVAASLPSEHRLGSAQRRGRSALERALAKK